MSWVTPYWIDAANEELTEMKDAVRDLERILSDMGLQNLNINLKIRDIDANRDRLDGMVRRMGYDVRVRREEDHH